MGFSRVSALAICGEGQEESSIIDSQRGDVGWILLLKTLFLVASSVWSEVKTTSREENIKNCLDSYCEVSISRHCQQTG